VAVHVQGHERDRKTAFVGNPGDLRRPKTRKSQLARASEDSLGKGSGALKRKDAFTMAKLTAKRRANLPAKAFGLPERARSKKARKESGNYPMPDRDHAISAIRRSERERRRGNLTKDEFERINRKARKVLKQKKGK
jgi:hypothetical protein